MKKLFLILMMLFCLVVTCYKAFFYLDSQSEKTAVKNNSQISRLTEADLAKIKEGDIILRRGFGFFSDYISQKLNDGTIDVTHAGIIIKDGNELHVIHSLSSDVSEIDGMQVQPLTEFLKYSAPGKIIITRTKGTNAHFGEKVALSAKRYLQKRLPFDHNGKYDDDTGLFCTELIWRILEKDLKAVKLPQDAVSRKNFFYSMMPMYDTQYFDIIINQYYKAGKSTAI